MSEQNSQNNSDDDDHHQNCCRCQDEINGRQLNDNDTISSIPTTTNVNTTNSANNESIINVMMDLNIANHRQQQQEQGFMLSSSNQIQINICIADDENNNKIQSSSSSPSSFISNNNENIGDSCLSNDDRKENETVSIAKIKNDDLNDIDIVGQNKQQQQEIQLYFPVDINNENNQQQQFVIVDDRFENINDNYSTSTKAVTKFLSKKEEKKRLKHLERQQRKRMMNRYQQLQRRIYWNYMPIDILEEIFQLLSIKERHLASQVCPHWFECFYSPTIWTTLIVTDKSFTKRKFNYYLGYQRMIDSFKTQAFLWKFGTNIRRLIIKPMNNFFNLYEFMKILSQFAEHYQPNRLRNLNRFDFTFGCRPIHQSINGDNNNNNDQLQQQHHHRRHHRLSTGDIRNDDTEVIGTGGKLLEALKELMYHLVGLKYLALRDLLLCPDEARYLLDNVAINCHEQLRTLTLINCCKNSYAFLHVGIFLNLDTLVISCQHLDEDVLILLALNRSLNHLYIVQTELTRSQGPLSFGLWKKFSKINHHIQIHLVMVNRTTSRCCQNPLTYELSLQPTRITSIIYDAPIIRPSCTRLIEIGQLYGQSLECLAFYHIPKYTIHRSYMDRVDTFLIYISENCSRLRTIIINDLISTATLLLIVTYARNLTTLYIRRNAIRKRFDCLINPSWREHFVQWLRQTSRSYEQTFSEISRMLGYRWIPLTDDQFKRLRPNVCL
ncbi:hypothetical protein DERF_008330 [Dermatophagoides farinae]|uniref:F-box domain-containing protein n=1 Tax=Dermatophagoides farinae TaxID=6954 RepID=A0A922I5G0_DERFA|nr:hypothetical protein DERF_008330 [Dermatophagoides farinae]